MNNFVQLLIGLVIAAFITILAAPYFVDWNQYKSEIEAQASRIVGRDLSIAGDVNLRLLPAPYLQLENITVNAPKNSANTPSLLTASSFRLWLSAPPLLRGVIEVQEIEIEKPHFRFALDETGTSNWNQEQLTGQALPFTPTAISLQSMKIRDGVMEVSTKVSSEGVQSSRQVRITQLNGDFSAGSIKGPYKFDGTIGKGKKKQILRFSTGRIDEKNELRVKSLLRTPSSGHRYAFDGSVLDLKNKPTLNGVVSASFPFFKSAPGKTGGNNKKTGDKNRVKPIEVKAAINANTAGALFDKILVTIVHKNRPQMLTGKGRLTWDRGILDLDGNLNARLIDIDHLKEGTNVGNSVGETINNLFANMRAQAARIDTGRFLININQIKLNGDLVQDVNFDLQQSAKGQLKVKRIFARLPGDNMIEVQGGFSGQSLVSDFKGRGVIRGQSLGHLVTWAAGTKTDGGISAIRSHPFTMRGNLLFGENIFALDGVTGDIASTSFSGEISYRKAQNAARRGEIGLKLTTSEIDSTALMGRPVAMREIIDAVLKTPAKSDRDAALNKAVDQDISGFGSLINDNIFRLQLRAGRLRLDDFDGRDLVADVYLGVNRLQINKLSLRSSGGLHLQADGTIDNIEKVPSGTLTSTINIEKEKDLRQFVSWFETSNGLSFSDNQITSLLPLRLAVMLQTATKTGEEANIRVNGVAGSSQISLNNRIIGSNLFSRKEQRQIKQLELSGTIANKDGRLLLTQIVPHLPIDRAHLREVGTSKIWFSAAGLPELGLNSRIEFNSKRVTAGFDGLLGWQKGVGQFQGTTRLKAKDISSGLALIGIDYRNPQSPGSLELSANLDKKGNRYDFTGISGSISSSDVEGRATLELGDKRKKIDLVILTSALHIPSLFSPLLELPSHKSTPEDNASMSAALQLATNVQDAVGTPEPLQKPLMTNRRFTSDLLKNVRAEILITADKLYLSDAIVLENGDLSATIQDRKIRFNNLGGQLWGGQMASKGMLDLSATLAQVSGDIAVAKAVLRQAPLLVDKTPIAAGDMSLKMEFEGKGIGPAGLFSLLNGSGRLNLSKGRIKHLSSSVLTDIVDDELTVWNQSEDQTPFKERFRRHLVHADLNIPSLSQKFTIKDGTLTLKSALRSKNFSKLDLDASLTLATMTTHSRLTISPEKQAKYENLPPASILYEGSLTNLDAITPRIDTASLEQHLKVMKMEHDVNLLEKLHKRDEEFAKKAAERRAQYKAQEEKRLEQEKLDALKEAEKSGSANDGTKKDPPFEWNPFN